jgi:hypothetical protein
MNEIEEFLKRAAAMRARQQASAPTPPRQAPPPAPPPPRTTPLAPLASRMQADLVEEAEVIDAEELTGSDVSQHVARYLDSGSFRERSSHLGETIKGSDEIIESHLHETFEHRLGQLGATTARAEDSTLDQDEAAAQAALAKPTTFDLRSLFQSPQNLRNAIILSEVLNPPRDRW